MSKKVMPWLLTLSIACTGFSWSANPDTEQKLNRIGTWDGTTEKAELAGPYVDAVQGEVPYGFRNFFRNPWRSYMDTWSAQKYLDGLGINFNVNAPEAEATAQILEEAGIRSGRIEIGWDSIDYYDDTAMKAANYDRLKALLQAMQKHRIRPLILLNFNSGAPNPRAGVQVEVLKPAKAGDRTVYFKELKETIRPKYTGFTNYGFMMYPIITEFDPQTGKATLSAPLPQDLPAGKTEISKLKYQPFSPPVFKDGTPNPASQETLDGWMKYVTTVTNAAKASLGTDGTEDAGFDIEVWNEFSFGYHFMNINEYYEPDLEFAKDPISYTKDGRTQTGGEVLLPMTIDYVQNPDNGLPGVRVINGFSNQRPWDDGSMMWQGQTGYSRHYYNGYDQVKSLIAPGSKSAYQSPTQRYQDAQGNRDGVQDPNNEDRTLEGSFFTPAHIAAYPELWWAVYQTESVSRDTVPFPSPYTGHFRNASPGRGVTPQLWMTETGFFKEDFAKQLMEQTGAGRDDVRLRTLMHDLAAKSVLRQYVFSSHKGLSTMNLYAAKSSDTGFAFIPESFYAKLKEDNYVLTDAVRAEAGSQVAALAALTRLMKTGEPVSTPRPLKVDKLVEYKPRLVFEGDGTAAHPTVYHRDEFAVLPYQLNDHKFAVGYYVVTRNSLHDWDKDRDPLDTGRYNMPEQQFELTLSNVLGANAKLSVYDPIQDTTVPLEAASADGSTLTVNVQSVDYPRILLIEEAEDGPVMQQPLLEKTATGGAVSFTPSASGTVRATFGKYPARSGGMFKFERYTDKTFSALVEASESNQLYQAFSSPGAWKWTGTVQPKYSEPYTLFITAGNVHNAKLRLNGELVFDGKDNRGIVKLDLTAGKSYNLEFTYFNEWSNNHSAEVYWSSASQQKDIIAAEVPESKAISMPVVKGEKASIPLEGMKEGDGVRLEFSEGNSIWTRFPFWSFDRAGVMYAETPMAGEPQQAP
ncbi:PA14 domain-containing protein [Paenibacillus piri]|uniref:PA14 domain-containing protein n=1 Tax=Paenibacillus piri TaxID=2547395 RepID=A0A4R5KWZ4_9BACL|nr:PA14 domain-containing protein [Paenibacillus piri]TDF99685.1 hypothetical protein E1757_07605 [Paenibacillus piri]